MIDIEKLKQEIWETIKEYDNVSDVADFINEQKHKIQAEYSVIKKEKYKEAESFVGTFKECREHQEEVANELKPMVIKYKEMARSLDNDLIKKWIKGYIDSENNYSEEEFDLLYDYAYSEGHSNGWYDVVNYMESISELYDSLLEAKNK